MGDAFGKVAIVGMSVRTAGANDLESFWEVVRSGREAVHFFPDDERPAVPSYVPAKPYLDDVESFDPDFFGISRREARMMDPQHRLFLECVVEALDDAGRDPARETGPVGVFASAEASDYLRDHVWPSVRNPGAAFEAVLGNDKDYIATQVSYRLDLHGPSLTVQSACSSSLAAVHVAAQNLLTYQCDMAIAGGVCIRLPSRSGYFYVDGAPFSRDGHCRPFDADASGTVFGDGAGVVVLRRLSDAMEDGDAIYAVLAGSAMSNDGRRKVGFTAPSVDGQREAIALAHELSAVPIESIGYLETHGTGTQLGDPIELAALADVFRERRTGPSRCALGAVKASVGHLISAAGVVGLIKTSLALTHRTIPPLTNFTAPNSQADLEGEGFYVPAAAVPWPDPLDGPRFAGVSAFGIGGTNVHAVLEAPPAAEPVPAREDASLFVLSANDSAALRDQAEALAARLRAEPTLSLPDVAFTLQVGRRSDGVRAAFAADKAQAAVSALQDLDGVSAGAAPDEVAFLFPGIGEQRSGLGAELYRTHSVFRDWIDRGAEVLTQGLGLDPREILFRDEGAELLAQTRFAQPCTVLFEIALAEQWRSLGLRPGVLVGYSAGEYAAAAVASVMDFEDALSTVAARSELIERVQPGEMRAVLGPRDRVESIIAGCGADLAIHGSPRQCVIAGEKGAIEEACRLLAEHKLRTQAIGNRHAFHSRMMDSVVAPLEATLREVDLRAPQLPILSTVRGRQLDAGEATDPSYWARQVRAPVEYSRVCRALIERDAFLLEVGPGNALVSLARQQRPRPAKNRVASSCVSGSVAQGEAEALLEAAGRLFEAGVEIDWHGLGGGARRRRVHVPGKRFRRQRCWIERSTVREARSAPALEESCQASAEAEANTATPGAVGGDIEDLVLLIWNEVLVLDDVALDDDFFELGGTSLIAAQIVAGLEAATGFRIELRDFFEAPTPTGLAEGIRRLASEDPPSASADATSMLAMSDDELEAHLDSLPSEEIERLLEAGPAGANPRRPER